MVQVGHQIRSHKAPRSHPPTREIPTHRWPIIRGKCLSRVLMDGSSRLNIRYIDTLNAMGQNPMLLHLTRGGTVPRGGTRQIGHSPWADRYACHFWQSDQLLDRDPNFPGLTIFLGTYLPSWAGRITRTSWPSPTTASSSWRYEPKGVITIGASFEGLHHHMHTW